MGPIVPDKFVKLRDPRLNSFEEIPPEAIGGGILDFFHDNFRPKVVSDVISGVYVGSVGMDVNVKLGDSR